MKPSSVNLVPTLREFFERRAKRREKSRKQTFLPNWKNRHVFNEWKNRHFFQSCLKNLNSVVQTLHLLELDLCERACLSATFISHQSLVEKRASVFEKRASVLSLEALLTALVGQCEPRPFIYWDNHRCRHVLLLLLDLSTVWVCTILTCYRFSVLSPSYTFRPQLDVQLHTNDIRATGSLAACS